MSEAVGGSNLFGSGGHTWLWTEPPLLAKELTSWGIAGAVRLTGGCGAAVGMIVGRDGGPALLRATGASRTAADAALTLLEDAIEDLRIAGTASAWEDDAGRTGTALVIESYSRVGPRVYGLLGGVWQAWQRYTCRVKELGGRVS